MLSNKYCIALIGLASPASDLTQWKNTKIIKEGDTLSTRQVKRYLTKTVENHCHILKRIYKKYT